MKSTTVLFSMKPLSEKMKKFISVSGGIGIFDFLKENGGRQYTLTHLTNAVGMEYTNDKEKNRNVKLLANEGTFTIGQDCYERNKELLEFAIDYRCSIICTIGVTNKGQSFLDINLIPDGDLED